MPTEEKKYSQQLLDRRTNPSDYLRRVLKGTYCVYQLSLNLSA